MNQHLDLGTPDLSGRTATPAACCRTIPAFRARSRGTTLSRNATRLITAGCSLVLAGALCAADPPPQAEVKKVTLDGQLDDEKARLVIQADLKSLTGPREKALYGATVLDAIRVSADKVSQQIALRVEALQGELREIVLSLSGTGEVREASGEGLEDWAMRQGTNGVRFLVLRLKKGEKDKPVTLFNGQVRAESALKEVPQTVTPLTLATEPATLVNGYVRIDADPELSLEVTNPVGVVPVETRFLPESLRATEEKGKAEPLAFRFQGSGYSLPLKITSADPEARQVVLRNFRLAGQLDDNEATFTLNGVAHVKAPKGGPLDLLSGGVALTELAASADWRLKYEQGRFVAVFDKPGEFPVQLKFNAAVRQTNGWNEVDFRTAPGTLQPVGLRGLKPETQFRFAGAARTEWTGTEFASHLPPNGRVQLAWKAARLEAEGAMFYSAESLSQVAIRPGLMRQTALLDFRVMQGELSRIELLLSGTGEVTRVQGPQVLAWSLKPVAGTADRRLSIQLNQPQKDQFNVQVQMQSPLGAFPQAVEALNLRPEGATRFGGHVRIVNEGAVRLEVLQASGLSQISPEQFPQTETTKALLPAQTTQAFAYRFSGGAFQLRLQADNILPEITVSEVLVYHLGETDLAIDAEFELDVREAPVRELLVRVPKGYAVVRLNAPGLSDYFLADVENNVQVRIVYGAPVFGRQVVQMRLERNQPLGENTWRLPRVELAKAKSVRGHVAVSADAGFRLTPGVTQGLTDIATAFFPRKVAGIQAAFRLSDAAWSAAVNVERLPQSIQADVFHLFSVGEGIAYGSSIMNFLISGAPVAAFKVELSDEYFNPEFTGKDIRNWQKVPGGYQVQLHTPVSGAYTLLAAYERPFKAQGETLTFTGARPADAQSEQGTTVVVSAYQFQVQPVNVSPSLLRLETGEVPPEYRLFFDAPILAAYRYTSRPFNLQLALQPLAQGETIGQVIDRAALTTRISEEGQVVTDARYFVKNKGAPNLRLLLPTEARLWSVTVNGSTVVPVVEGNSYLIPLPQRADANTVNDLQVKTATRAKDATSLTVAAPVVAAPVLLAEWRLVPDEGRRLVYRRGTLTPASGLIDRSGFAGLWRLLRGDEGQRALISLGMTLVLSFVAAFVWRSGSGAGVHRFTVRHVTSGVLGAVAFGFAVFLLVSLVDLAREADVPLVRELHFIAPVQQANSALSVQVDNLRLAPSGWAVAWTLWPALAAAVVWVWSRLTSRAWLIKSGTALGWFLAVWAALRWPNGVAFVFGLAVVFLCLHVAWPLLRRWWRAPRKPKPGSNPVSAPAAAALLVGGLCLGADCAWAQSTAAPATAKAPVLAASVSQEVRVEKEFVVANVRIHWPARKGQVLPLLHEPGVLTRIEVPADAARLVQLPREPVPTHGLLAEKDGALDIKLSYQSPVTRRDGRPGFALPTQPGLVNQVNLTLVGQDLDVEAAQAVSVRRVAAVPATNTVVNLVIGPVNDAWISWKPRARDPRREQAVFYAEFAQLYVPGAGVVMGWHQVNVRPAQGELSELVFDVPAGLTVTDVEVAGLSLWRFDPEGRLLRLKFVASQPQAVTVLIKSQIAAGPLPFEQNAGLISLREAAGQLGLVGVATGTEVQLDDAKAGAFSAINLEDFPVALLEPIRRQVAGLALRRAFRYSEPGGALLLQASAVAPEVRVEAKQTLSLGEDRTVLAATLEAEITRAGIFKLSFVLPTNLDVESVGGPALSHWTELKTDEGRIVTLHLKSRTEGKQAFTLSLVGPGTKSATNWAVPRLVLREAEKQRGQLLIVPEQGLRLQVTAKDGLTQLDPLKSGVQQKGVLAFRLLQRDWNLALELERVDAWTQVASLQHFSLSEAQVKVAANLQYEIENTGLKSLRVRLPANAESVRFRGEQLADFVPHAVATNDAVREWEVKLHRRVIGQYLLQANYDLPLAVSDTNLAVLGVVALDVNLQRGFVTLQTAGRLQARVENPPPALQPAEWQSIPRALQQGLAAAAANYTFRLVEPDFRLPVRLERHQAAQLLEARVLSLALTSVLSDDGVMLTQVRLQLVPGDKRLLHLTLPDQAQFWFAFVNHDSVWPWRETNQVLLPLEQHSKTGEPTAVEFFYSSQTGRGHPRALDLQLRAPKFDLPLENITWRVFLNEKWRVTDWTGTLQLQGKPVVVTPAAGDLNTYISREASLQKEKTKAAEQFLSFANRLLASGDQEQARRNFQTAFSMSQHDAAFNEDARVQLHNLKMQQALVGLNVSQARVAGESGGLAAIPRALREGQVNYTQQEAKQLIERNPAEENAVQMRLAERLIQQQDAAIANPAAIRASIPEQGRLLTFTRALEVNRWADLRIDLAASAAKTAPVALRLAVLAVLFAAIALLLRARRLGSHLDI
jgi:hypothetical protein